MDAIRQQFQQQCSEEQGIKLIQAAAKSYPSNPRPWTTTPEELMLLVSDHPHPGYVPVLLELFPRLPDKAQDFALRILAQIKTEEATRGFLRCMQAYAAWGRAPKFPAALPLERQPRHAHILFPAILACAEAPPLANSIYLLCLAYCDGGLLTANDLAPHAGPIVARYGALHSALLPWQERGGRQWTTDEQYFDLRMSAGILLDLFGHFPTTSVQETLETAIAYRDPRLKFFAIRSLVRLGCAVAPTHLEAVAADPETRGMLYDSLQGLEAGDLFPQAYATQAALAEADMVQWLSYPAELGQPPDAIELMQVFTVTSEDGDKPVDLYLFRFRSDVATEKGWMAGISGPFPHDGPLESAGGGCTFSKFEPWDTLTPEEHLESICGTLTLWHEHHNQE